MNRFIPSEYGRIYRNEALLLWLFEEYKTDFKGRKNIGTKEDIIYYAYAKLKERGVLKLDILIG